MELSYIDLLNKLINDVQSDIIPEDNKKEILETIYALQDLLWQYSY